MNNDFTKMEDLNTEPRELPIERVARRACLVADPEIRKLSQLAQEPAHRFGPIGDRAQGPRLVAPLGHRHRDRLRVHVQPYKSCILSHRPAPLSMWLCTLGVAARSVTHDLVT